MTAKRMVCDHIHSHGGINNIDVHNRQLLLYCANARHRYSAYLEEHKSARSRVVAGQKRRALNDEVGELKVKRRALQTDADDFSDEAEKLQQLTLLAKANGMRRAAREKAVQRKELNQLIDNKLLELENCS